MRTERGNAGRQGAGVSGISGGTFRCLLAGAVLLSAVSAAQASGWDWWKRSSRKKKKPAAAESAEKPAEAVESRPELPALPPMPAVYTTAPGRFEIVSYDAAAGHAGLAWGNAAWAALARPLGLPPAWREPVRVWLVPAEQWTAPEPILVTTEINGLVRARIRRAPEGNHLDLDVRRGLARALLVRQAVSWHGAARPLTIPLWLEYACAQLILESARPAMYDAWRQEAGELDLAPRLEVLLRRGAPGQPADAASLPPFAAAAKPLMAWLESSVGRRDRWFDFLRRLTAGDDPAKTLADFCGERWADNRERELAWQTGFEIERGRKQLPLHTPAESRLWLRDYYWLAARNRDAGRDVQLAPDDLYAVRQQPWVSESVALRLSLLEPQIPAIHPFYRNAALSLGRIWTAVRDGKEKDFHAACAAFVEDMNIARDLEDETADLLDAAE
ncbi:hypothetical protein OPIT5_03105 [Opitutaceae bacterium TAV5]|nr:hypothetical protein OPIT5_03105 [Opitutaceae bacterium TAV5]